MTEEDQDRFDVLIGSAYHAYRREVDDLALEIYFKVLKPYPFEEIEEAVHLHMTDPDSNFCPTTNEIIANVRIIRNRKRLEEFANNFRPREDLTPISDGKDHPKFSSMADLTEHIRAKYGRNGVNRPEAESKPEYREPTAEEAAETARRREEGRRRLAEWEARRGGEAAP